MDKTIAEQAFKDTLTKEIPYNAKVDVKINKCSSGWFAPLMDDWLEDALKHSCNSNFNGKEPVVQGEGGSIPFMGDLGRMFPSTQFVVTGVLGWFKRSGE